MSSGSVASPLSTGGAGTIFEYRVAAVVLAALLRGDRPPGLEVPVTEVRLQQRIAGHYLDDVIAIADHPGAVCLQVDFQVKRSLDPVTSDTEWQSVVAQCLDTLEADRDRVVARHHLLGLAARAHVGHLEELQELTRWAREHPDIAVFLTVVDADKGGPNRGVRSRWKHLRTIVQDLLTARRGAVPLQDVTDEAAHRIAAALWVWVVKAEDGEDDHRNTLNRLGDLLTQGQPNAAQDAFLHLADIAQARGTRAGGVTAAGLRAEMERRHVPLAADPRQRADLAELDRWTSDFLDSTRDHMAGTLHLPRTVLLDQLVEAAAQHRHVLVTGRAGAGKSALARQAARWLRDNGATVVALSLTERQWRTLADVEADIHARLATALAGAPTTAGRMLLIDGAEQVLADGGALLTSLLQEVPHGKDALPWHVLLTARDEATGEVREALTRQSSDGAPHPVVVGDLTDTEVGEVLDTFGQLRPLERHSRPRRLLRRPYLVDLLVRGSTTRGLPERLLAEEDVVRLVYEGLIRSGGVARPGMGAPDARSDVYLAMADSVLTGNQFARLAGTDAHARAGLVSDNVLDRKTASYRFSHDVLADYAVATTLLEPDGAAAIADVPEPRRILRSVRLWMQGRLADSIAGPSPQALTATWASLRSVADVLAIGDGERWRDVPYEALLNSGPVEDALRILIAPLTANGGAGLASLMDVTLRHARLRHDRDNPTSTLDVGLSAPVVGLLAALGDGLPDALSARVVQVVCAHLLALPGPPGPNAGEQVPCADLLPAALVTWTRTCACHHQREERDGVEALAMLAAFLDAAAEDFLLQATRDGSDRIGQALEEPLAAQALARHRPHLLQRLALLYFLGDDPDSAPANEPAPGRVARRGFSRRTSQESVRPHAPRRQRADAGIDDLAHPDRGPFAALLGHDPERGLALVGKVVDRASSARVAAEAQWQQRELALDLQLPHWPQPRTYRGTPTMWGWYQRQGTGAFPAMSALMALHAWAAGRRQDGAPLREVVDDVLGAGTSLALVAVAVAVLTQDLDTVDDALDPFLAHPLVWFVESARLPRALGIRQSQTPPGDPTWSHVAMCLVLNASAERREVLRGIGEQLTGRSEELVDAETSPLADLLEDQPTPGDPCEEAQQQTRRWAALLDIDHYRAQPVDDTHMQVSVDYPADATGGHAEARVRRARAALELGNLMHRAVRVRDGHDPADPAQLHADLTRELEDHYAVGAPAGGRHEQDAAAAVAAAVILSSTRGADVADTSLAWAAAELLETARRTASTPLTALDTPGQAWECGADRSAATALPVLLTDTALRERSKANPADVTSAITSLAGSFFVEVRVRLAEALQTRWEQDCTADPAPHETALATFGEMIATAGRGPWGPNGRPYIRLPQPLEKAIADDDIRLDPELTAPAIPGLATAAAAPCPHGRPAATLLDAITAYDRERWPAEYGRRHYVDVENWRRNLDRLIAERALEGDPAPLHAYMTAFAAVPEDLSGALLAMGELATTPERTDACHDLWPQILDTLLPAHRTFGPVDGALSDDLDVQRLDEALLPLPPLEAPWPTGHTADLLWKWVRAYAGTPRLVGRLLRVLVRNDWLAEPGAIAAVLIVLGTDLAEITRRSGEVVSWLKFVLTRRPDAIGEHRAAIQSLLDRLAAAGSEAAVILQRELEA